MSNGLIVFVKNPVLGKVKTRLAKTIGDDKALIIYRKLLEHTRTICETVDPVKFVFYNDFINPADEWKGFEKRLQAGNNLGKKMEAAFTELFANQFSKAVIIGSDCLEITTKIIEDAFEKLNSNDVVIGPAMDGGYYLLGMKELHHTFFENKQWSTNTVLQQTIQDISSLHLSYYLLPTLNDIDEEKDLLSTNLL